MWPWVGVVLHSVSHYFAAFHSFAFGKRNIEMERRKDEIVTRSFGAWMEVFGLIAIGTSLGRGVHKVMAETKRL